MGKILITESVHAVGPDILSKAGHQVVYADRDMDVIRREIVDADAVFVRIIELPQSLLETGKNLKIPGILQEGRDRGHHYPGCQRPVSR